MNSKKNIRSGYLQIHQQKTAGAATITVHNQAAEQVLIAPVEQYQQIGVGMMNSQRPMSNITQQKTKLTYKTLSDFNRQTQMRESSQQKPSTAGLMMKRVGSENHRRIPFYGTFGKEQNQQQDRENEENLTQPQFIQQKPVPPINMQANTVSSRGNTPDRSRFYEQENKKPAIRLNSLPSNRLPPRDQNINKPSVRQLQPLNNGHSKTNSKPGVSIFNKPPIPQSQTIQPQILNTSSQNHSISNVSQSVQNQTSTHVQIKQFMPPQNNSRSNSIEPGKNKDMIKKEQESSEMPSANNQNVINQLQAQIAQLKIQNQNLLKENLKIQQENTLLKKYREEDRIRYEDEINDLQEQINEYEADQRDQKQQAERSQILFKIHE